MENKIEQEKNEDKEINSIIEKISVTTVAIFSIIASVLLALGILTVNGKSISFLSAPYLAFDFLDMFESSSPFQHFSNSFIGIAYIVTLIKSFSLSLSASKRVKKILSNITQRDNFKLASNVIMTSFYSNIFSQFAFVIICSLFNRVKFTNTMILYFVFCIAIFMFAYISRLCYYSDSTRDILLNSGETVLYLVSAISACLIAANSSSIILMGSLETESFKEFLRAIYSVYIEPIMIIVLLMMTLRIIKKAFDEIGGNNISLTRNFTPANRLIVLSILLLVSKCIVNIYLQYEMLETQEIMHIIKRIFVSSRYVALPLLILGIAMNVICESVKKSKKSSE